MRTLDVRFAPEIGRKWLGCGMSAFEVIMSAYHPRADGMDGSRNLGVPDRISPFNVSWPHPPTAGVISGVGAGRPRAPARIAANILGEGQRQRIAEIRREPNPLADVVFLFQQ